MQAPDCAYAWVAKCSNNQLRKFVADVSSHRNSLFTKLNIGNVAWSEISRSVFAGYLPNTEKNERTVNLFAELWGKLAGEFLNDAHIDEYNSIKHGFRVRSGGFSLAIGLEHEYGVTPPQNEMKCLGHSKHGTTIIKLEKIGPNRDERSYRSKRHSLNWSVEKTALLLQLASMSINNVTSAMKISNGIEADTCKFTRPLEDDDFATPWSYSTGVTSSNMDDFFKFDKSMNTSKEQLQKQVDSYVQSKVNK
ncbi:hypothetical protein [Salinimonas chungwhensis]|uniref:hypothetical protein n=1 Tax=Salinimonas chungwhensis TaxID=265425 RepID=UPI00037CA87A|nr:hypothetical protein [Salinimonas chungwhensis]